MTRFALALPSSLSFCRVLGWTFLLTPIVWNVWIVERFLSSDGDIANTTKVWIWMFDFVLVVIGLLLIKYERKAISNIFLVMVSVIVGLGLFELILRSGLMDNKLDPHPVWVPKTFNEREDVRKATAKFIEQNPLGFNDIPRSRTKPEGHSRIAVLGDSFIQGWLMHYDEIWSHRLEKRVQEQFKNIEVLSWGKSGWGTLDEFRFLKEVGVNYGIDLLIVGYVFNDTDLLNIPFPEPLAWYDTKPMTPIRLLFPNVLDYVSAHINLVLGRYVLRDHGYETWISKIHSEHNLKEYGKLLKEFSDYCASNHIRLLFVLTPNDYDRSNREMFDKVIPLLTNANIEYLDLYPAVYDRLHTYPQRQLWVTLADAHPGPLVTEVYADEVFRYLKDRGIFDKLAETGKSRDLLSANETVGRN